MNIQNQVTTCVLPSLVSFAFVFDTSIMHHVEGKASEIWFSNYLSLILRMAMNFYRHPDID